MNSYVEKTFYFTMLKLVRKWLLDLSLYLDPHKKLMGFILGQRPVRRPSLEEIFSVVFVYFCRQTSKKLKIENKASNLGGGKNDTPLPSDRARLAVSLCLINVGGLWTGKICVFISNSNPCSFILDISLFKCWGTKIIILRNTLKQNAWNRIVGIQNQLM